MTQMIREKNHISYFLFHDHHVVLSLYTKLTRKRKTCKVKSKEMKKKQYFAQHDMLIITIWFGFVWQRHTLGIGFSHGISCTPTFAERKKWTPSSSSTSSAASSISIGEIIARRSQGDVYLSSEFKSKWKSYRLGQMVLKNEIENWTE